MKEWRKRKKSTPCTKAQRDQAFVVEPRGDKRNLQKGGLVVVTPPVARKLELSKVSIKELPVTHYTSKTDISRVEEFMDMIARGIPLSPPVIHRKPDGSYEVIDGKHKVEAFRRMGYKHIPVVENATLYDTLHGLDKSEGKFDQMPIIGTAIEPMVSEPLFIKSRRVELSPEAAADLGIHDETTLGYSQRLRAKGTEVMAKKGLKKLSEE
jgi:hypothetical protein